MYIYAWSFVIFSFIGWLAESIYASVRTGRPVNRGFLNGPLCPVYGFGVVIIDFLMRPLYGSATALLVGSLVLGSGLELLTGFLLEKIFHHKWWDYSNEAHNFHGYLSLKYCVIWAFGGMAAVGLGMPAIEKLAASIPKTAGMVILIVILSLVAADFIITSIAIFAINHTLKKLKFVSKKLAAQGTDDEAQTKLQKEAARLSAKYEKSLRSNFIYRRILKAFPELIIAEYNEQLESLRLGVIELHRRSTEVMKKRNQLAAEVYEGRLEEGREKPFAFGMCYSKLFWIFMIGNVVGCLLETLYALLVKPRRFEIRTSLVFGPFILVYGLGAIAITLFLRRMYNQKDSLIFIASMVIGGGFEYLCSFIQQVLFGTVSWEYSGSALNIGGRTNLMYSVFWGVLGLLWVKDAFPALSRMIESIPKKQGRRLTVVFSILMAADILISAGAVYRSSERVNNIPAQNIVQEFFDRFFPDSYLEIIYPHMEYVGKPTPPTD